MKILVTGGAGFVGTNLIKKLLENNHKIISVDNYNTGLKSNHQKGCEYLEYDIVNIYDYNFIKPDLIFHMAAMARIQPSFDNPIKYFRANVNGTMQLAHYCAKNNIPLIYAGSSSHHSGKYKNPYTFSKDIGEEVLELFSKCFSLKYAIARFYNVYGPYQLTEGGYTTLIGRWINNIKNGLPCEIYGDGSKRRDFTHVKDIIKGLTAIVDQNAYGYTFEFGKGKNHSVLDVAKMFNIDPIFKENKPGEAQETLADYTLAKEVLGWTPEINLQYYINNLKL